MQGLFSDSALERIRNLKKIFLWSAVCILIGELVVGVFLILFQTFDLTVGKLMGTFGLCAIALFVGVNNFSRMEKGERIVQSFALTSLLANIVWLVLAVLFIWEVTPFLHEVPCQGWWHIGPCHDGLTTLGKIMVVAIDMTVMCFLISNVWSIAETVKPVKPLKNNCIDLCIVLWHLCDGDNVGGRSLYDRHKVVSIGWVDGLCFCRDGMRSVNCVKKWQKEERGEDRCAWK